MRDLSTDEIGFVYGAGSSPSGPCKGNRKKKNQPRRNRCRRGGGSSDGGRGRCGKGGSS